MTTENQASGQTPKVALGYTRKHDTGKHVIYAEFDDICSYPKDFIRDSVSPAFSLIHKALICLQYLGNLPDMHLVEAKRIMDTLTQQGLKIPVPVTRETRGTAPPNDYISGLDKALEIVNHSLDEDKFLDGTAGLPTACWAITERIAEAILKERAAAERVSQPVAPPPQ